MSQVTRTMGLLCLLLSAAVGWAQQDKSDWPEIGTVSQWMAMDARFYRILDDNPYLDRSQFRLDQVKAYAESRSWKESFPEPMGLDGFQALGKAEQSRRRKLAADQLKFVERFRRVQLQRLQQAMENHSTVTSTPDQDRATLTKCLLALHHATGLDPENYFAWHLQSYFAACCGDVERSRQCLLSAAEALQLAPAEEVAGIARRVELDLIWLDRDQGLLDQAQARLDKVEQQDSRPSEALLLRGLIAAQSNDQQTALRVAARLNNAEVKVFPTDYQKSEIVPSVVDPRNWETRRSSCLQAWITALLELKQGQKAAATKSFPEFSTYRLFPYAWHFWNDAGYIYERTGRPELADKAWSMARISHPWLLYMVYHPYAVRLGALTGNPDPATYALGFDSFYLTGSRLAYGASLVGRLPVYQDLSAKQTAAAAALDELEICRQTGFYPGQASILMGQVHYLMGDLSGALAELQEARKLLEDEGDEANLAAVVQDLAIIQQNLDGRGVEEFFGQSGRSQGRWDADPDPAATEKRLTRQLKDHPGDADAKLALARHLIRHGQAEKGRQMAFSLYDPAHIGPRTRAVVTLVLEADRILGQQEMADLMLRQLAKGNGDRWPDAGLWALVGSICQDHGRLAEARSALQEAQKLDPQNQGIINQLRLIN